MTSAEASAGEACWAGRLSGKPPRQLRGLLRHALRIGLETIRDAPTPERASVGWKLFLLAPRMLLYRPPGTSRVPPDELRRREALFQAGQ